jgi:hypothetical protein
MIVVFVGGAVLLIGAAQLERYLWRKDDDRALWVGVGVKIMLMAGALALIGWAAVHNPLGALLR